MLCTKTQTRYITRTRLQNVVISVHELLVDLSVLPERKAFCKGKFLHLCAHLLPLRSWPRSWSCTYGDQQGSFRSVCLGRWENICRAKERSAGAGLAMCAAGRTAESLGLFIFSIYYSCLSVCIPCLLVFFHVLSRDPSLRAGEDPARKSWQWDSGFCIGSLFSSFYGFQHINHIKLIQAYCSSPAPLMTWAINIVKLKCNHLSQMR